MTYQFGGLRSGVLGSGSANNSAWSWDIFGSLSEDIFVLWTLFSAFDLNRGSLLIKDRVRMR